MRNSIPDVLQAISTLLSQSQTDEIQKLVNKSLEHGVVRAEQGYDAEEIMREYRMLRQVVFSTLESDLLKGSATDVLQAVRKIDIVLDEVSAMCLESYTRERMVKLEQLHNHLKFTNQELTRLVDTHQDNLSYLAHELKNPLNSIIGYSNLLLRKRGIEDASIDFEHIERVLRNGQQLLRLINDVLEISRYEAGKMKLQPKPTDVRALVKEVKEALEPSAQEKELQLVVECDRAPDQVLIDSLRLQQILTNLISNAIRYTDSGTIQVTCQQLADNQWFISVSDPGIGIAREEQAQIFEPYFRSAASSRLPESTGLGLAIVSRLVKLLQGEIQLVSQVGEGSTFTVTLPLAVKTLDEALL